MLTRTNFPVGMMLVQLVLKLIDRLQFLVVILFMFTCCLSNNHKLL